MNFNVSGPDANRPKIRCKYARVIAYFDCLILLTSVTLYILLLQTFVKNKKLLARSLVKQHVTSLALVNLASYLTSMPFSIVSNFQCRWAFPYWTCPFTAAIYYFNGISCMYITCLLSYQRLKVINKKFEAVSKSTSFVSKKTRADRLNSTVSILFCYAASAFWSIAPIMGWSKYSYNQAEMSCKINAESVGLNSISFGLSLFLFTFLLPQSFIIITNVLFWLRVKKHLRDGFSNAYLQVSSVRRRLRLELITSKKMLVVIGLYSFTWTPRASLGIYSWLTGTGRHDINYGLHAATIIIGRAFTAIAAITFVYLDDNVKNLMARSLSCQNC